MTQPPSPTPTGLSLVRNVAQMLRLVLESPEHGGIRLVLSRAAVERWADLTTTAVLLLEHEQRHQRDA